ncbi:MAG: hypothetical protein ACRDPE_23535 [Solirubrobacterales bacterium]
MDRALIALVQCNGSAITARELLLLDGIDIPKSTLALWPTSKKFGARYEAILAEEAPRIRRHAAQQQRQVAERAAGTTMKIIDKLDGEVDEIEARDLPGAARNMATVSAIAVDKADVLEDKPTQRVQIDMAGTLKELLALGVQVDVIEGSAEEIPAPALTQGEDTNERKNIGS